MKKPKRAKKIRILIITVILIYFMAVLYKQQMYINEINEMKVQVQEQIGKIKDDNEHNEAMLEAVKSHEHIEKIAREKLGMVKPGEIKFIQKYRTETENNE